MRYTIKEHLRFKLRKPYKRRGHKVVLPVDYHRADERKDGESKLKVNVLIMAKENNKNNRESRMSAGDLFGKLGRKPQVSEDFSEEYLEDFVEETPYEEDFDSIDVSDGAASDSDLDINELLQKYMPEYEGDTAVAEEAPASGGVLSKLKRGAAAQQTAPAPLNEDEMLMSALDSAFDLSSGGEAYADEGYAEEGYAEEYAEEGYAEEYAEEGYAEEYAEEGYAEEYAEEGYAEEYAEEYSEEYAEEEAYEEELYEEEAPKKGFFASLLAKLTRKNKEENAYEDMLNQAADEEYADAEDYAEEAYPVEGEEEMLRVMPMEEEGEYAEETVAEEAYADEYVSEPEEAYDGLVIGEAAFEEETDEIAEPAEAAEATEEADLYEDEIAADEIVAVDGLEEDFDPTDINLMVAFGLDNGENKHADRAKELGDRLEAIKIGKGKKFTLDVPEYVDKTQTPKLRKEFREKERSLWIRIAACAVLTFLLLIFENISVLTGLFGGTPKQFAGVLDPAVYPGVYAMVSLQLMVLACLCAYDQIVEGVKSLLRGAPKPESMTVILGVAGVIYSFVMANVVKVPTEPVMFNFVVALSALLNLVYAMLNHKREMMNFRVVANKKPKHIVRRMPDEESECEAKAFADAEDVCDVMKIEKTDFVDGFFGRLREPDASNGIFMTFVMSVAAAIAVLFGIFMSFRGGDSVMVTRTIYSSLLIIAPLSVYMTFSYPFYRANLAAKEYDSAIIGEAALEEYSNASIISFDDKNVFPSYSVKVQNIRIYNNARIDRVLYYAASVFAHAGGPLQDVFEVATRDMGISNNVEVFDTEAGFLATQVDGVNIIFGNGKALMSRGLDIPEEAAEDDVDLSDELEIMYMFRESKLVAKMYIQYVMDADIDLILKQFAGNGLYVCVRTFDPNIDERMIARKLNMRRMPLKILRYRSTDEVGAYAEKVNSGLVTCGTPKSLLHVISYCGKVLHTKKTNLALSVLSVMIGLAILILLLLSDSMGSLNSLFVALYQLIWIIPMLISSRMFIR